LAKFLVDRSELVSSPFGVESRTGDDAPVATATRFAFIPRGDAQGKRVAADLGIVEELCEGERRATVVSSLTVTEFGTDSPSTATSSIPPARLVLTTRTTVSVASGIAITKLPA
jgi:hypothetical protein